MSEQTVVCIAGHGLKPDGSFDPGAKGYITKGEHKYMKEDLFPAMQKYVPKDSKLKFVFYSKRNVLHYGDIVSLANSYGKDTIVIEFHYDAFTAGSEDGHVIIWGNFKPDALDLRLRDVIKDMVGLRFAAYGEKGISARTDLGNAKKAAKGGVNYRLVELGFGTHQEEANILMNDVDKYARKLVEAILNTKVEAKPVAKPVATPVVNKPQVVVEPKEDKLLEDGSWGPNFTKALQRHYGTTVDGVISGQLKNDSTKYIFTAKFGSGGSMLIRAMQKDVGTQQTGQIGYPSALIKALQKKYGTQQTGKVGYPSMLVKEMQHRLNNGTF